MSNKDISHTFSQIGYGPVNIKLIGVLIRSKTSFYFVRSWMYDGLQVCS